MSSPVVRWKRRMPWAWRLHNQKQKPKPKPKSKSKSKREYHRILLAVTVL